MIFSYRVTKYNPENRNEQGHYLFPDEWTSYFEVGSKCGNKILSLDEYLDVEKKYIGAVIQFMNCLGISTLQINGLEQHKSFFTKLTQDKNTTQNMLRIFNTIKNGDVFSIDEIQDLCKLLLRRYLWCRLENNQNMFVHFGYDYYMYIGSKNECKGAVEKIEKSGLFVEDFISPYLYDDEEE